MARQIVSDDGSERWRSLSQLRAWLATRGVRITRKALDRHIEQGLPVAGRIYRHAEADADDATGQDASVAPADEAEIEVSQNVEAVDGPGVVQDAAATAYYAAAADAEGAGVAGASEADAVAQRSRVRIVVVECQDCPAEAVASVLSEIGRLFGGIA